MLIARATDRLRSVLLAREGRVRPRGRATAADNPGRRTGIQAGAPHPLDGAWENARPACDRPRTRGARSTSARSQSSTSSGRRFP
jgi:hypothetical protein